MISKFDEYELMIMLIREREAVQKRSNHCDTNEIYDFIDMCVMPVLNFVLKVRFNNVMYYAK